ncbi:MAG: Rid family hydrolase [Idiomarina sp.]
MKQPFSQQLFPSSSSFLYYIEEGSLGFITGVIAQHPVTGKLISGDFSAQVEQTFHNLNALLAELGLSSHDISRTCIQLCGYSHLEELNQLYSNYFKAPRATVLVNTLPLNAKIQVDAVVRLKSEPQAKLQRVKGNAQA